MRRLMLLRHAKTENDAPSGRDQDRRLDERGRGDAADIGDWIARHPPFPDFAIVSSAIRAQQTWEAALEAMEARVPKPKVEIQPELYGADPSQLLEAIHAADAFDPQRLMLVGHNPGMHELALALVGGGEATGRRALAENLPTAALAVIDFAVGGWSEVAFRRGELVFFVTPKLLKQASDD